MRLTVEVLNVQSIKRLRFGVDVEVPGLFCIVGRNGSGKTTLVRALRNLSSADTFAKTASPFIFGANSSIYYSYGDVEVLFAFDARIRALNCRQNSLRSLRGIVAAELPIPHGDRFGHFRSAADSASEIGQKFVLGEYRQPLELAQFLNSIYSTTRFNELVEIAVGEKSYYSIKLENDRYLREDHLSSGEYFLINLYRTVKCSADIIVIDEIEVSLDAAAQVQLAAWLRRFCAEYRKKIVFTTHSLALMRTLEPGELAFLEPGDDESSCNLVSYNYVKSRLFGFRGWDKYILTEDKVLKGFLEHILDRYRVQHFFTFRIVHIGGYREVVDLMRRNAIDHFFAAGEDVMAVLDGDANGQVAIREGEPVTFLPFESVEKAIWTHYRSGEFPHTLPGNVEFGSAKDCYNALQQRRVATVSQMNDYLCDKHSAEVETLVGLLAEFLGSECAID